MNTYDGKTPYRFTFLVTHPTFRLVSVVGYHPREAMEALIKLGKLSESDKFQISAQKLLKEES